MRPAVTFALVAYNQEEYVREAIEGAFAQDFEPLEIILSDDCSSDSTFAIMQAMAAAYRGPHRVIARQERPNVGTVRHLINIAREASGELLVIGAGDDISYPQRVSALHAAWKETDAAALSSWHDEIDEGGNVLRRDVSFPAAPILGWLYGAQRPDLTPAQASESIPGFCAAYPREFWARMPDPATRLLVEDGLASALILVTGGKIHRVRQSLIAYRLLEGSMSNRQGGLSTSAVRAREDKIDVLARDVVDGFGYFDILLDRAGVILNPLSRQRVERTRAHHALVAGFWNRSPLARIVRAGKARSRSDLSFLLPRLIGFRAFARARIALERRRARSEANS